MFIKNCWQVAAFSTEVVGGRLFARKILDEPIVFFRSLDRVPTTGLYCD